MKHDDHAECLAGLERAQKADHDNRERAREADLFIDKRDGQWEPTWVSTSRNKPRYTFDQISPMIDKIYGELIQADYAITVDPAGGESSEDDAKKIAGLIRNIENISDARTKAYGPALKGAITKGIDGWKIVQKYCDADSFDQDLVIEHIPNFVDSVWFDEGSSEPDASDTKRAWLIEGFTKEDYKERWPEGKAMSLRHDTTAPAYWNKADLILVGEYYFIKEVDRELVLMSNGSIYPDDEDFKALEDEFAELQITEVRRRNRKAQVVCTRKFDGAGWLSEASDTVFNMIPIVPEYANFKIVENKILYRGIVEKQMDAQRVLNYSLSREIEEGALADRAKYWMTEEQAIGYEESLSTLNVNTDPVQFYNFVPEQPLPAKQGGAQVNPGLRAMSMAMSEMMQASSGIFDASMGASPNGQSGVAIQRLQDKGDIGNVIYTTAHEIAICQTFRILASAIPKVYKGEREARILNEDRTSEVLMLNQEMIDAATGKKIILNDLSRGAYKINCRAGPAFRNRQEQAIDAIISIASVDPSVIQLGGDVILNNINAPGMDLIAARKRKQLIDGGIIPVEQMTDAEKQALQQKQAQEAQQGPKQDPAMLIGQAELMKAQNEQQKTQISVQKDQATIQLQAQKQRLDEAKFQQAGQEQQFHMMYQAQQQQMAQHAMQMEMQAQAQAHQMAQQQQIIDALNTNANTMKTLREALGIDAAVLPEGIQALQQQAQIVSANQSQL